MKLDVNKKDIKDKVLENTNEINELKEAVTKTAAYLQTLAEIQNKQKNEILELKQDIEAKHLDALNNIKLIVENLKNENNTETNINNNADFDDLDLDFLAEKLKQKLNNNEAKPKQKKSKKYLIAAAGIVVFLASITFSYSFVKHNIKQQQVKHNIKQQQVKTVKTVKHNTNNTKHTDTAEATKKIYVCENTLSIKNETAYFVKKNNKFIPIYNLKKWNGKGIIFKPFETKAAIKKVGKYYEIEKGKYIINDNLIKCYIKK